MPTNVKEILTLSKGDIRIIAGLLTGHCPLNYHLHKIGKAENNTCRLCQEDEETSEHILCDCPAVASSRLNHFEKAYFEANEVKDSTPGKVVRFIKSLDILQET